MNIMSGGTGSSCVSLELVRICPACKTYRLILGVRPACQRSGVIVPITDEPYVYQGETVFTEEAHAVVTLTHVYDGSNALSPTRRIAHVEGFPISFHIEGNAEGFFNRSGGSYPMNYYDVSATVYMGAGDKIYIGDFVTDILFQVNGPTAGKKIRVTGLEACGSPNGGGACAEDRRP